MHSRSRRSFKIVLGLLIVMTVIIFVQPVMAQTNPNVPQVAVFPEQLERISWSAIIAGSIVALILQLALNLLAIGIGVGTIHPADSGDTASAKSLGTGAVAAIVVSMLVSMFIGGWMAARFSGTPERVDGLLHGVMVWGIVTLVTVFLLMSTFGRFMSGMTSLLSQGLRMAGLATQAVAKGTSAVAEGALKTAQSAAGTVQDAATNAQHDLENTPEVADIRRKQNEIVSTIKSEASKIMQQTGITPEALKSQAQSAGQEVKDAAQNVLQNPGDVERIFNQTLTRILNQGQALTSQADKDTIVDLMVQRGNVSEDQARQTIERWENRLRSTQQQMDYVVEQAKSRAGELRTQVEDKVEEVKEDAEHLAREAAQATTEAISKLALAAFAAIAIGILAASIGGYVGTPETLPTAAVNTSIHIEPQTLHPFA